LLAEVARPIPAAPSLLMATAYKGQARMQKERFAIFAAAVILKMFGDRGQHLFNKMAIDKTIHPDKVGALQFQP